MKKGRGGENRIGKGAGKRRRKQIAGIAGTWEQGARSREQRAGSRKRGARNRKKGDGSRE